MSCSRSPQSCAASLPCGISAFGRNQLMIPYLMVRKEEDLEGVNIKGGVQRMCA